jgi:hypothetical protein
MRAGVTLWSPGGLVHPIRTGDIHEWVRRFDRSEGSKLCRGYALAEAVTEGKLDPTQPAGPVAAGRSTTFVIWLRCGAFPSHGWNELRPSIQRPDLTGHLHSSSIRWGNPTPDNEKELFGSSTDAH